jgi:RNA polymerase sigma-70 factor (ECF subfamily)
MIELAGEQTRDDDRVVEMLLSGVPEAHRLAAWVLRDPIGAEDAVQEALLRAWSRRGSVRFELGQPHRWFMRIVLNVCRDELRRRRRQPIAAPDLGRSSPRGGADREVGPDAETLAVGPSPDQARYAANDDLERAIGRLKEDEQIVLGLRFGRDMTVPQIAAQLEVPEGTVKSRLHYALEHVRAALDAERRAEEQHR